MYYYALERKTNIERKALGFILSLSQNYMLANIKLQFVRPFNQVRRWLLLLRFWWWSSFFWSFFYQFESFFATWWKPILSRSGYAVISNFNDSIDQWIKQIQYPNSSLLHPNFFFSCFRNLFHFNAFFMILRRRI